MSLERGDGEQQEADRGRPGMMRQRLISLLEAPAAAGNGSRLDNILEQLIAKAEDGDLPAIKEIFDRVDGKSQAIAAADDGERKVTFEWLDASSSPTGRDLTSSASTSAPSDSPAS